MIKIVNTKVHGLFESIIRSGYPMRLGAVPDLDIRTLEEADLKRSKRLTKVPPSSGHNNFLKGIIVQFDLLYPEYFSPQLQRYHWIDIISSQSKMHKLISRPLTQDNFTSPIPKSYLDYLNELIKKKEFTKVLQLLPMGYLKWMGISTNYLQLVTIYNQRKNHKLEEWRQFCAWIESLPQSWLITKTV